jgi:hypothetical protein
MRFSERDVFKLGHITVAVTYNKYSLSVDSVLVLAERQVRPSKIKPVIGFVELVTYLGRNWYDALLRSRLYAIAETKAAHAEIKRHGSCNLIREAAVRLLYRRYGATWVLAGCEIYRDRVQNACRWEGDLPYGLAFDDLPTAVSTKLGRMPELESAGDLESFAIWSVDGLRVVVIFDQIINLISSITVGEASYWDELPPLRTGSSPSLTRRLLR